MRAAPWRPRRWKIDPRKSGPSPNFLVILASMTYRVGPKGQVVIPKVMRDRLGIIPGDEVSFVLEERAVRMEPIHVKPSLLGILAGLELTAELEADRRKETER